MHGASTMATDFQTFKNIHFILKHCMLGQSVAWTI